MDKAKQHNNKKDGLQQMKKLSLPSTVDQVNSLRTTALFNTTLLFIILSFLVSIAFDKQSEKVIDPQVEEQLKEILDFIRNPNITINE
tara:strand:- start:118 stop:381 length:264 start_codon:yes stop_codon:yes gene_type:complete